MANYSSSGMGGPLQPRPPAPAAPAPMNMAVSAEKRSKLKSYMEGYKDAIESKTAEQLLPNISPLSAPAAMPPMQRPVPQAMPPAMSQPPMMMNMGGMVDVFDPNFMNNLGSEIMDSNEDNILYEVPKNQVQGFRNGGFTTNINVGEGSTIGGRDDKDENDYVESLLSQYDEMYKSPDYTSIQDSVPSQAFETETYQGSNVPVGSLETDRNEILEDALFQNELRKARGLEPVVSNYDDYEMALPGSSQGLTQRYDIAGKTQSPSNILSTTGSNFTDFMSGDVDPIKVSDDDLRMDEDKVESINPMYEDFKKSQESMFAPFVNKIGMGIMGYKDPFELYKATQATLADNSMQSSIARDRLKDQERKERRLAEEQRMRDMIQSMLPPKDDTIGTGPIGDIDVPPDFLIPLPDDYIEDMIPSPTSPIVESTRVPGFNLGNLPAFPQFNMPTQPVLPPIIQPNFFNQLLSNMKMPVAAMQEGGNVKSLDAAVENFIEAIK